MEEPRAANDDSAPVTSTTPTTPDEADPPREPSGPEVRCGVQETRGEEQEADLPLRDPEPLVEEEGEESGRQEPAPEAVECEEGGDLPDDAAAAGESAA